MAKRSGKPRDLNRLAASIVNDATDESTAESESQHARAGRKGGIKGGMVRAARLTPAQRAEIARKGADARWRGKADR